MVLASVTRVDFKIRSELEIVHIPTGAVFQAYPYSDPDDMLQSVKVIWGRAGVPGVEHRRLRRADPTDGVAVAA
jgi:hypothetical protein